MTKITEKTIIEKTVGMTCDRCNTTIPYDTHSLRTDNFTLSYTYGYGTEFDGDKVEADICDYCLHEIIEKEVKNARITEY